MTIGANTQTLPVPIPVSFDGDQILYVVAPDSQAYVPVTPICGYLGIDARSQRQKLDSAQERWGGVIITLPSAGGPQEMLCLPLGRLFGWLMTIQPSKVKPTVRDKLIRYQQECDRVLEAHFLGTRQAQDQALEDQRRTIETLERQHRQLAHYAMAFNGKMGRVAHLLYAGVHRGQVWRILGWSEMETAILIEEMERLGVIKRDDWRPSMWGIADGPSRAEIAEYLKRQEEAARKRAEQDQTAALDHTVGEA